MCMQVKHETRETTRDGENLGPESQIPLRGFKSANQHQPRDPADELNRLISAWLEQKHVGTLGFLNLDVSTSGNLADGGN